MLTPKFEVQQDETCITVKIFARYAQITDAEVSITEEVFTFYSSPYYLRLTFSGKLVDSELEEYSAKFDADAGAFIITCKKETPGEHFTNLDLLTMLLTPQGATGVNRPSIEVIGGKYEIFLYERINHTNPNHSHFIPLKEGKELAKPPF
ncbi:Protein SHQ1 [Portunus trituberculatus]|uniref:Protein SHQ1 n=1 Tax=Portunus trituberculatus TaxID=210409 RepID=A0A5B7I7T0_PORTR|nr:Protein SHQ1 [Portunus trituberculatus]